MYFEVWVSLALLGIFSCVSAIYTNGRKNTAQLQEMVKLLSRIAEQEKP